jgi:hypothetical protein
MFKIGDKVKIKHTGMHAGKVATIVSIDNHSAMSIEVVGLFADNTPAYFNEHEIESAIINAPVKVDGKMPINATRKMLTEMFKSRKVMKADFTNRNNTLGMRAAAKTAYVELCSRIRCELVNGARSRVVPFGWDKV